jgi:hypothetical protein
LHDTHGNLLNFIM